MRTRKMLRVEVATTAEETWPLLRIVERLCSSPDHWTPKLLQACRRTRSASTVALFAHSSFVAKPSNVVGALVGTMSKRKGQRIARIDRLIVAPGYRRQGIASRLLEFFYALTEPLDKIVADVPDDAVAMHEFLKSCAITAKRVMRDEPREMAAWSVSSKWPVRVVVAQDFYEFESEALR